MRTLVLAIIALPILVPFARAEPVAVVAAENMYGDVARQIGGSEVAVTSILNNPEQDPHLFEASPSVARRLAGARIAIANGAGYDPWMAQLLAAGAGGDRRVIVIADLVHAGPGGNPHLWYDPAAMPALAEALAGALAAADPAHAAEFRDRREAFLASLAPIRARIAALRGRYAGAPVTATEPVFGLMAAALGLAMRNQAFQLAIMNGTEPSAAAVGAMEDDLRRHRVRLLIHNSQASDAAAERLLAVAREARLPVLGVTETEPAGTTYQQWVSGELDALDQALAATQ